MERLMEVKEPTTEEEVGLEPELVEEELMTEEEKKLEIEEEPEEAEKEPSPTPQVVSTASSPRGEGWELFGHLLVEDRTRGGRVSLMRCVRCGVEAPLTELGRLREVQCINQTSSKTMVRCEVCGREVALPEGSAPVCDECDKVATSYCLTARPVLSLGRDRVFSVRPPVREGVEWAWVKGVWTFFPSSKDGEGRRVWACPRCQKTFGRLSDAVEHLKQAHLWEANHGVQKIFVPRIGDVYRFWQGLVCPRCGALTETEDGLRSHQCMGG